MKGKSYRLLQETHVVLSVEGQSEIVPIPAGDVIIAAEEPSKETGMITVIWRGRAVRMFIVDLERRGEPSTEA